MGRNNREYGQNHSKNDFKYAFVDFAVVRVYVRRAYRFFSFHDDGHYV